MTRNMPTVDVSPLVPSSEAFVVAVAVKVTSLVMALAAQALAASPKDPHLVPQVPPRQLHCSHRRPLALLPPF